MLVLGILFIVCYLSGLIASMFAYDTLFSIMEMNNKFTPSWMRVLLCATWFISWIYIWYKIADNNERPI